MTVQYLIDSENVGDFWIPLLDLPGDKMELIVFYTRNSPHMSYDSLIKLKESDRKVTFIKCYEGTNALDFQLVSELGYRICQNEDGRFVIVTNDTGFDAAVKYWRRRKKSVKRITGKECRNPERRNKEDLSPVRAVMNTPPAEEPSDAVQGTKQSPAVLPAQEDRDQEVRSFRPSLRDTELPFYSEDDEDADEMSATETGGASFLSEDPDDYTVEEMDPSGSDEGFDETDGDYSFSDDEAADGEAADDEEEIFDKELPDEEDEPAADDSFEQNDAEDLIEGSFDGVPEDSEDAYAEAEPAAENKPAAEEAETAAEDGLAARDRQALKTVSASQASPSMHEDSRTVTGPEESAGADEKSGQDGGPAIESVSDSGESRSAALDTDEAASVESPVTEGSPAEASSTESFSTESSSTESSSTENFSTESSSTESSSTESFSTESSTEDSMTKSPLSEVPLSEGSSAESPLAIIEEAWEAGQSAFAPDGADEEEAASDSGRRQRSRRSRLRRSKTGSKKQDQAGDFVPEEEAQKISPAAAREASSDSALAQASDPASDGEHSGGSSAELFPSEEEIARITACIGTENLAELHNQLATIYGEQGKEIYLSIRKNPKSIPVLKADLRQKFSWYCEIVLSRSDYSEEYPKDLPEFLLGAREKLNNLNSLRYALQKQYGKEKGRRFYYLLKPYAKAMYQM